MFERDRKLPHSGSPFNGSSPVDAGGLHAMHRLLSRKRGRLTQGLDPGGLSARRREDIGGTSGLVSGASAPHRPSMSIYIRLYPNTVHFMTLMQLTGLMAGS